MFGATKPVLVKTFQSNLLKSNGVAYLGNRPVYFSDKFPGPIWALADRPKKKSLKNRKASLDKNLKKKKASE